MPVPFAFTLRFLEFFLLGLFMLSPVVVLLAGILFLIAFYTNRCENWGSFSRSLYFTLITALTVGYGRTVPDTGRGRILSILSGVIGIILAGILVSTALNSVMISWQMTHGTPVEASLEAELETLEHGLATKPDTLP